MIEKIKQLVPLKKPLLLAVLAAGCFILMGISIGLLIRSPSHKLKSVPVSGEFLRPILETCVNENGVSIFGVNKGPEVDGDGTQFHLIVICRSGFRRVYPLSPTYLTEDNYE